MTICLALLCDDQKKVVAVADRMVSVDYLSLQFEQHTRKVDLISQKFAVLTAGDALGHTEIIRGASLEISQLSQPSVFDVASSVEAHFIRCRQRLAENTVLRRVGLDYTTFLEHQRSLSTELVSALMSEYQGVTLGVELLIAGVDGTGAHLYMTFDPGITECFDSIGYAAIGSGLPHAESFLAEADYSPSIPVNKAIWLGYVAKRRSERAPGVGSRYTDVLVIDAEQGTRFLDEPALQKLDAIYQQYLGHVHEVTESVSGDVAALDLSFQ